MYIDFRYANPTLRSFQGQADHAASKPSRRLRRIIYFQSNTRIRQQQAQDMRSLVAPEQGESEFMGDFFITDNYRIYDLATFSKRKGGQKSLFVYDKIHHKKNPLAISKDKYSRRKYSYHAFAHILYIHTHICI